MVTYSGCLLSDNFGRCGAEAAGVIDTYYTANANSGNSLFNEAIVDVKA